MPWTLPPRRSDLAELGHGSYHLASRAPDCLQPCVGIPSAMIGRWWRTAGLIGGGADVATADAVGMSVRRRRRRCLIEAAPLVLDSCFHLACEAVAWMIGHASAGSAATALSARTT